MDKIRFIKTPEKYKDIDAFVAHLSGIAKNKEELFEELHIKLKFPYFGFNWDALYDCLNDFDWINEKRIVLVHHQILMSVDVLKIYPKLLLEVSEGWKDEDKHSLEIIFPEQSESLLQKYL